MLKNRVGIDKQPLVVDGRQRLDDWEGMRSLAKVITRHAGSIGPDGKQAAMAHGAGGRILTRHQRDQVDAFIPGSDIKGPIVVGDR